MNVLTGTQERVALANRAANSNGNAAPAAQAEPAPAESFTRSAKDDFAMFKPSAELQAWAATAPVKTLPQMFEAAVAKDPDANYLGRKVGDSYQYMSYADVNQARKEAASGLIELGIQPGERVASYAENSPEWMVADLGVLTAGGVHAAISRDSKTEAISFNLKNSSAKAAFVDTPERLQELLDAEDQLTDLHTIVVKEKPENLTTSKNVISWDEFMAAGKANLQKNSEEMAKREADTKATDPALIIFTSGTTGNPKAVVHTHGSLLASMEGALGIITGEEKVDLRTVHLGGDRELLVLPLDHIFEKSVAYSLTAAGASLAFPETFEQFGEDIHLVKPTVVAGIPRLYNTILEGARKKAQGKPIISKGALLTAATAAGGAAGFFGGGNWQMGLVGAGVGLGLGLLANAKVNDSGVMFDWALDTSEQYYQERDAGGVSTWTNVKHEVAKKLVYSKSSKLIKDRLGPDNRVMISGGAPLPDRTAAWFWDNGFDLNNGYGSSEMAVTNVNPIAAQKLGTVGPAVAGVEIAITPDEAFNGHGEIRVKSPSLMLGYLNDPDKTAKAFDEEGYYRSGDIGTVDNDGHLLITDRLKNFIALSTGKKVAGAGIESQLEESPFIDHALLVGEGKKHIAALVVPNVQKLSEWAGANGHATDLKSMAGNPAVKEFLQTETKAKTSENDGHEQVWKIAIVDRELSDADLAKGEPKRPVLVAEYHDAIEAIYEKK